MLEGVRIDEMHYDKQFGGQQKNGWLEISYDLIKSRVWIKLLLLFVSSVDDEHNNDTPWMQNTRLSAKIGQNVMIFEI